MSFSCSRSKSASCGLSDSFESGSSPPSPRTSYVCCCCVRLFYLMTDYTRVPCSQCGLDCCPGCLMYSNKCRKCYTARRPSNQEES